MFSSFKMRMAKSDVSAFTPLDLSPTVWLSDTGSDPGTWPDLSGNGYNFTQASPSIQPLIATSSQNGLQCRRMVSNDYLEIATPFSGTDYSVFAVFRLDDTASINSIFTTGNPGGVVLNKWSGIGTGSLTITHNAIGSWLTKYSNPTTWISVLIRRTTSGGNAAELWANNVIQEYFYSTSTTYNGNMNTPTGNARVGGSSGVGDIGEIVALNRRITDTEKNQLFAYAQAKWSTP